MNLILIQKGFPPVIIKNDDRAKLLFVAKAGADNGDLWPFAEYIVGTNEKFLDVILKGRWRR